MKKSRRKKRGGKRFVDSRYAKSGRYRRVLADVKKASVCPFCPETFRWHTKPILKTSGSWFITESFQPYRNAKRHFLIIGKKHQEHLTELSARDVQEILGLAQWAVRRYAVSGGGLAMRFGGTAHTGATVSHLHMHLLVPKLENGRAAPVWFPFG